MTTGQEQSILVAILEKVSETREVVARLEQSLVNATGRLTDVERDVRELRAISVTQAAEIQRQGLEATAAAGTAVALAKALKDDAETRRDKTEQKWTPLTRLYMAAAAAASLIAVYYAARPHG